MIYSLFVSHKVKHGPAARALKELLLASTKNIEIFICEEIEKGENYRERIEERLGSCTHLMLLFSSPEENWDWCIWEAGFFRGQDAKRPIYCLHMDGTSSPAPLDNLQSTKLNAADVAQWYRNLFVSTNQQGGAYEKIAALASGTVAALEMDAPMNREYYIPTCSILAARAQAGESFDFNKIKIRIEKESARMLRIEQHDKPRPILDFCKEIDLYDRADGIWVDHFKAMISDALRGVMPYASVTYFRDNDGKIRRPFIFKIARSVDGKLAECSAMFLEAYVPPVEGTGLVQRLSDLIRLSIRMKYEVLRPFMGRMEADFRKELDGVQPPGRTMRRLVHSIDAILQEARLRQFPIAQESSALELFEKSRQTDYERLRKRFFENWGRLREIQEEASTPDHREVENILVRLSDVQHAYFRMILDRFAELSIAAKLTDLPQPDQQPRPAPENSTSATFPIGVNIEEVDP